MNALPTTGELFATNQVSPATGYPIADRSRAALAAYARQPGTVQELSEELGLAM